MTTIKVINNVQSPIEPVQLSYGDIIEIKGLCEPFYNSAGQLFLIAQVGRGMMCLFSISDETEFHRQKAFNRTFDPAKIATSANTPVSSCIN